MNTSKSVISKLRAGAMMIALVFALATVVLAKRPTLCWCCVGADFTHAAYVIKTTQALCQEKEGGQCYDSKQQADQVCAKRSKR